MTKENQRNDGLYSDDETRLGLERKLSHSYQLLQYIIEHDLTAIAVLDRELRYIYVSRRFLSDYNVTEKDILGRTHYEVFPDLPDSWKEVHKRALNGETIMADDDNYPRSDGKIVWVKWVCKPWYGLSDTIEGIILYTEVITKAKEAEQELKKAKEKAEESDKLKTAFLQNISHEVRTPLNSIIGFSDLISQIETDNPNVKRYSEIITENSTKLISIISDVIDISQIQSGHVDVYFSKFELSQLFNEVVNEFRDKIKSSEVSLSVDQNYNGSLLIETDKRKVRKILFHLLDNAIKFTKNGSIKLVYHVDNSRLNFTVADTGIGISEDNQKKLFVPFWQNETGINRNYGGMGIGLAVTRAYVNLLGGSISLTSQPDKGTTIDVMLPIQVKTMDNTQKSNRNDKGEVSTILIAEDESSNYNYLYEVLHSDKVEIIHANNGYEAVDICKSNNDIDMVLMDIRMPVMDGTSAAVQIREIKPDMPIIAQTAFIPDDNSKSVFDELITKPVNKTELEAKVRKYIEV